MCLYVRNKILFRVLMQLLIALCFLAQKVRGRKLLGELLNIYAVFDGDSAAGGTAQAAQVCSAAQRLTNVVRKGADVSTLAAANQNRKVRQAEILYVDAVEADQAGLNVGNNALSRKGVGALSVHLLCRELRRRLQLLAQHALKLPLYLLPCDACNALEVAGLDNVCFQIVGWCDRSKANMGKVLLLPCLQRLCLPRSLSEADNQQACCQRVERSGVANLKLFFARFALHHPLHVAYGVKRRPTVRFVERQNNFIYHPLLLQKYTMKQIYEKTAIVR
jgi:hypothetical protein